MKREALADRCLNYADALVAYSLVNGLAFLVALGEPDLRCSIARISAFMITLNLSLPLASMFILRWLGRTEDRLRRPPGDDEAGGDEDVDHVVGRFRMVRHVMVWLIAAMIVSGIVAATQDVTCFPPTGG